MTVGWSQQPAGYSGKPLRQKLGFVDGMRIQLIDPPDDYEALLGDTNGLQFVSTGADLNSAHIFVKDRHKLDDWLPNAMSHIIDKGFIWVSWPKGSSGVATDINENLIREVALPLGLVDIKVCAIDETWSGLKLVRRKTP